MNKNKSILTLLAIIILSILATFSISKLKFNYDFETYFPSNDDDLDYLIEFRKVYGNDTDFLIIGIKNSHGIYQKDFLQKLKDFTFRLDTLQDVEKVTSITNFRLPVVSAGGYIEVKPLHPDDPGRYASDSIFISRSPYLTGNLVSKDAKSVAVLVNNTQNIKKKPGDRLLQNIEKLVAEYDFEEVHVAGKIKASIVYVEKMQYELIVFISASTVLIGIFLYIAYRSAWGIIIPLITVIISILWTLGIMRLIGKDLDLLTSLLPPILFVVAMSDMTHLISKYLEELRYGHEKSVALKIALKEVGVATFITALTTAVGFVTLINSNIKPIADFGFYTAIGVFVAYLLAFSFLPAVLTLMKAPAIAHQTNESLFWHKNLQQMLFWIFRNKYNIVNGSVTIMMLSLFFISKIEVNSTILDDISDRDPLKKSVSFFEREFGGIRPFEMTFTLKDSASGILDYNNLEKINQLEIFLTDQYKVKNILSPVSLVKILNQSANGGNPDYYRFPDEESFQGLKNRMKLFSRRPEFASYLNANRNEARISGKMEDVGSKIIDSRNEQLVSFISGNLDTTAFKFRLTGSALLVDKNNKYLAQSLLEDLLFGIISIGIIIGFLFRSLRMIILALIPNLIPLLVIGGIMGIFGIHLKASTSIIFSIAFGIAVDDSIHFLSRFRLELQQGKHFLYALKRTYISTGKAMIVTSLILISGFVCLLLSTFEGTFYTGLLISLTLLVAIIADLLLLPVLLILFYRPEYLKRQRLKNKDKQL